MRNPFKKRSRIGIVVDRERSGLCVPGYTTLDQNPEIQTACRRIAELIGTITIHLMKNTDDGDIRIKNELSRKIDVEPFHNMTRKQWVESFVMTMLLRGRGNAIVIPHTRAGILKDLEPVAAGRVSFIPVGWTDYKIVIDGKEVDPDSVLHFRYNPDPIYLWKGQGVTVALREVANNLKQAGATRKGFLESKWMPSVIINVDALTEELSTPEGRDKILDSYISSSEAGKPWIIPAEQFQVESIKPLSLADLAIADNVEIDKRTVAAVLGVPPFVVGVGEYDKEAWNAFIQNTVRPICIGIQQELTQKLILSPEWYLKFNTLALMDWDIKTIADVFGSLSDKGYITGNEVRDRLGMNPLEGLDELRVLENYIPWDMSGLQKKLVQDGGEGGDDE